MLHDRLLGELLRATIETLYMVGASTFFACIVGIPLGMLLFQWNKLSQNRALYVSTSGIVNFLRAIPFIILLVLLIPVTRFIVGSSIGSTATIVPLSLGAIPFVAKLVENAFNELPKGSIELGYSLGATPTQITTRILLPDVHSALIQVITMTAVTLVSYSAMAGAVGGGGLGDLAIRYGYQRFDTTVLIVTVCLLVLLVQSIQWIGNCASRYCST